MKKNNLINLQYTTIQNPLPSFIYKDLKRFSSKANLYYPQPKELINKLSQKHHLPPEMFFLTAGIDEALQMFALAHGKNAVVFTPTYVVYQDVEEFGGRLTKIHSLVNNEYSINPQKYPQATLIFLANPNNPTGYTAKEKVIELIKNNQHAIVVIDEAYAGFANLTVINLTKKYRHLAILRSFSKDYGMAGNRIGYIAAHPKIIDSVRNKTQWCNVSYLSVGAALSALNHEQYFTKMRKNINRRRENFVSVLKKAGLKVLPSQINAVLIKFSRDQQAEKFVKLLKQDHIIVNHGNGVSFIGLDYSFVRITIGNAKQMNTVSKIISKYQLIH